LAIMWSEAKQSQLFLFRLKCLLYARDQFETSDNTST